MMICYKAFQYDALAPLSPVLIDMSSVMAASHHDQRLSHCVRPCPGPGTKTSGVPRDHSLTIPFVRNM